MECLLPRLSDGFSCVSLRGKLGRLALCVVFLIVSCCPCGFRRIDGNGLGAVKFSFESSSGRLLKQMEVCGNRGSMVWSEKRPHGCVD